MFDNPNASLTMTNYITGPGSLTFTGYTNGAGTAYILTLTDTGNNYSGGTIVQGPGELKANAAGTLGSTSGPLTVSGGILDLGGASHTAGTVTISGGTIQDGTLTGSSYAGQGGTVSAVLAGSGAMTKTAPARDLERHQHLHGQNHYYRRLIADQRGQQPGRRARFGGRQPVDAQQCSPVDYGLRSTASFTLSANRGITLGANGGSIHVYSGNTVDRPGIITGTGPFQSGANVTTGYGTLQLSGANNYSGTTTVAAGTLQLGANGALPYGTSLTVASDQSAGSTLDLNSHSQTIGPLASSTGIGGTGTKTPIIKLTGALTILQTNISTTFAGNITGAGGSLTLNGNSSGTLTLSGTNTYSGNTTISAGTLALGSTGSISNSALISIAAGAAFDVSAISSYALSSSTSLGASGTSSAATIKGASGGTVSLGSRPITLTYDGSHPALYISQGTLQLQGNAWTVNASPALAAGAYTIAQQASDSVTSSGSPTVSGTAIGSGKTASIQVSGANVNLVVQNITTTTLAAVPTPQTYGTVAFSATVSPSTAGGTVTFKDGTTTLGSGNLSGGTAAFTPAASQLTVAGSPHSITAVYSGDTLDTASASSPSTLNITAQSLTAGLTGTASKTYDGTTTAPLAAANYTLPGVLNGDTVNLNNPASGTYDTRNVGAGKTVTVTGLAISGASAGNYALSSTSASAAIGAVSPTNLTVTAVPNTKTYDGTTTAAATPTLTAGGIQTGDTAPAWTETYDTKDVGTGKTLTPAGVVIDGNNGLNYNNTYAPVASGVINALTSATVLTSSANPSGPGTNVTFTAAVNGAPPAADLPTGNVVFSANGAPFATNTLVSGGASASTASLPSGTNALTAQYLGDGNFLGSTGSVAQVVQALVNSSPTNLILGIVDNLDGTFTLTFVGTPQTQYYVVAYSDLTAPMSSWVPLAGSTNTVTNTSGLWSYTVTNTDAQQFYRSAEVVPGP